MIEIRHILFPCDFSENSTRILPYVLSLSQKYDGTVHLLHVVEDLLKWGGFYVPPPPLKQYHPTPVRAGSSSRHGAVFRPS